MKSHSPKQVAVCTLFGFLLTLPCLAETPEELLLRLERGRNNDAVEERRRQETLEWQKRRKEEAYSARWKSYGDFEVDVTQWRQQKDGVWITVAKYGPIPPTHQLLLPKPPPLRLEKRDLGGGVAAIAPAHAPKRFDQTLDELVRQGVITPEEGCLFSRNRSVCKEVEMGNWIGVSCKSLHFNKKIAGKPWGKWERPMPGSNEERLVVDRCAS
jgi:hypothetical protein